MISSVSLMGLLGQLVRQVLLVLPDLQALKDQEQSVLLGLEVPPGRLVLRAI
jgi:hypothetical protein